MSQITINIDNKNGNTSISIYSNGDVDVNDVPVEEVKYGWKMKSLTWVHKTQGFGERLRQARREHLYTQQSLADKLGVTQSAVTEWEKGRACPKQLLLTYWIPLPKLY